MNMIQLHLKIDSFKRDCLFKKPVFIKQAFKSELDNLKEFYKILFNPHFDVTFNQENRYHSLVKVMDATKVIEPKIWCHNFGRESEVYYRDIAALKKAIELKCSVIFDQYYRYSKQAAELVAFFQEQFNCMSGCNAYLSQKGGSAFPIHRDAHHVLIFSLSGKKRWKVFNKKQDMILSYHEVSENISDEEIIKDGLYYDELMEPGDMLYIPIGQFHSVENLTNNALHLTISMAFRPVLSMLEDVLKAVYTSENSLISSAAKQIINSVHPIHRKHGVLNREEILEQIVQIFDSIKEVASQEIFVESQNKIYKNDLLKICCTPTEEFIEGFINGSK